MSFPWHERIKKPESSSATTGNKPAEVVASVSIAVRDAVGQWGPLMSDSRVKHVVIMNGFYWFALAGAQMTLLPLMLTDPEGLAMSATSVGKVYMGMSLVQVLGNPIVAHFVDQIGKVRGIVTGCALISSSMVALPICWNMEQMGGALFFWALGSTMLSTAPVAHVSDVVDHEKRAQAIALLRTSGDIGFLLGATGTGALADWTGNLDVAMHTSAGLLLSATGWFATRQYLNHKIKQQ
jgi:MFS family permease